MKKLLFILLSLSLIIALPIFAEEPDMGADPFADSGADPFADSGASGDVSLEADVSIGGDMPGMEPAAQDPGTPDMGGALMPEDPGAADMAGSSPDMGGALMPEDPGTSDMGTDPFAGMEQQQMPGDSSAQSQAANTQPVIDTAPETEKTYAPVKAALPKYKAVPYTNDLRVMDKNTGELGQVDTLRRLMDWAVEASSSMTKKNHNPMDTRDLNAYTAWVENKDGYGEGESLTLYMDPIYFSAIQEGGVDTLNCTGLKVINGYNKSKEDWFNNSRVKIMKIYKNNKPFCMVELYDSTNWQDIKFKKSMKIRPDDVIKAEIIETFEGYKYPNAAITEFLLVGKPAGEITGYDALNGQSMTNVRNGGMYFK